MNYLLFKKRIRALAVKTGFFRPLRNLVFRLRGGDSHDAELTFHRSFLREGMLVFDVGANRGQSSETFLALGARVVAFEPQTELHGEISQACRRDKRLTILPLGLGAREESRTFFKTAYDQVASLRDDWEGVRIGETVIEISTLDLQIARFGVPDFCKIDVEGWEIHVFEGLTQALPLVSFEYHITEGETQKAIAVLKRIASLGPCHCNIREPGTKDFSLSEPLPIADFIQRFPDHLGMRLTAGYGDIFCSTSPERIAAFSHSHE
jgi:FkbM family methyltransferase